MRIRRAATRTRAASTIPAAPNTPEAVKPRLPSAPPPARSHRVGDSSASPVVPRCSSRGARPPDQRIVRASSSQMILETPGAADPRRSRATGQAARYAASRWRTRTPAAPGHPLRQASAGHAAAHPPARSWARPIVCGNLAAIRSCGPPGDRVPSRTTKCSRSRLYWPTHAGNGAIGRGSVGHDWLRERPVDTRACRLDPAYADMGYDGPSLARPMTGGGREPSAGAIPVVLECQAVQAARGHIGRCDGCARARLCISGIRSPVPGRHCRW